MDASQGAGLRPVDVMASPVRGPAGNVEFLLHTVTATDARAGADAEPDVEAAVAAGLEIAGRP